MRLLWPLGLHASLRFRLTVRLRLGRRDTVRVRVTVRVKVPVSLTVDNRYLGVPLALGLGLQLHKYGIAASQVCFSTCASTKLKTCPKGLMAVP